ncbi:MAG TPA: CHAT domain-containing protein [Trebonia sp.]|nr:CHAT domain-containing protein [Trebonia sp.]
MLSYNIPVVVVRRTNGGDTRTDMNAVVDSEKIFLPVDADIEKGDHVEQRLPNGKTRTMLITRVGVLQSPFGSTMLDHTEAAYTTVTAQPRRSDQRDWVMSHDQSRQMRLLTWLAEQDDGIFELSALYSGDDEADLARRDVGALGELGLVRPVIGGGSSLVTVQASITSAGRARAGELTAKRRDRSGRQWACRSALISWLYDIDAVETMSRSQTWSGFFTDTRSAYFGDQFSEHEVDRAAAWLYRHKLIDGATVNEADGPIRAYALDEGVRCVERFDADVRRYLDARERVLPPPQGGGPTYNVQATNVQMATGDRSHQTMTAEDKRTMEISGLRPPQPEPLRILYLTAASRGDLRVDEEIRRVKAGVQAATHRDLVQIQHKPAATSLDLLDGLTQFKPHVVHFSGHADETVLVFDTGSDKTGPGQRVSAEMFARAISAVDTPPTLVVLNACRSKAQLAGLLDAVPLAIGMSDSIGDADAMAFAARFYATVADGQSVEGAYKVAKVAMELSGLPDADLPILINNLAVNPAKVVLVTPPQ